MNFSDIPCHKCGGRMHPKVKKIKTNNGQLIFEVIWKCGRCGSIKGAIIGGG
jgi:DNA-directed RNA polymerase subunit M/transcription elongation factor TFIIS